ncbi:MAG: LamG-like jellyroll fold domain-containing protein [Verrucomicrobiota bacterium]
MKLPYVLFSSLLLLLLFHPATVSASLTEGLLFYLSGDQGSEQADWAMGKIEKQAGDATSVKGKVGQALQPGKKRLTFQEPANFKHAQGTVAFWTDLDADVGEGEPSHFSATHFVIKHLKGKSRLVFMTGDFVEGQGFKWDYGAQSPLSMAESGWNHIAVTWDAMSGERRIYLNGIMISNTTTDRIRKSVEDVRSKLLIGNKTGTSFPIDELAIWERCLSDDEIRSLISKPEHFQQQVAQLPPPERDIPAIEIMERQMAKAETILKPGETFQAKISLKNNTGTEWQGDVRIALLDHREDPVVDQVGAVTIPPGETVTIEQIFTPPQQGIYKVAVSTEKPAALRDIASFAVWPENKPLSDDSFFGLHVNSWSKSLIQQAQRFGYRWNRNHNMLQTTWWPRVQPEPGEFKWTQDESLETNKQHGFNIMGQFFGTPYWAAASGPMPPQKPMGYPYGAKPDLKKYREYVKQTVERYQDSIQLWEVWNEPAVSMFWNGSPEELAELVRISYETVKAVDPDAIVINAGYTSSKPWIRRAAAAGSFKYTDGISIHMYYDPELVPEIFLEQLRQRVTFFRELMEEHGNGPDMPIYQTEGGSTCTTWLRGARRKDWPPVSALPPVNAYPAMLNQVKTEVFLQALGFEQSYMYLWNSVKHYRSHADVDINGAPKPKSVSRAVLAQAVDGHDFVALVEREPARTVAALYGKRGEDVSTIVMWTGLGGAVSIPLGEITEEIQIRNIMGVPVPAGSEVRITEEPVYLTLPRPASEVQKMLADCQINVLREPDPIPSKDDGAAAAITGDDTPFPAALENPGSLFTIDLRPFTNMGFADKDPGDGQGGWADEGDLNDLSTMNVGRQTHFAVPFDVIDPAENKDTAVITLKGTRVSPTMPVDVKDIPVGNREVRALYFLHAAAGATQGKVAGYVIHYTDGTSVKAPVVIGKNIDDWWKGASANEESRVIAVAEDKRSDKDTGWRYLRVWEWQNPKPKVPIRSIDFISAGEQPTPILIGISGVTW